MINLESYFRNFFNELRIKHNVEITEVQAETTQYPEEYILKPITFSKVEKI